MAQITAYCDEAHGLRLGPGTGNIQTPGQVIVFQDGYATFDEHDFPDWKRWLAGAPHIEILDDSAGEIPATTAEHVCSTCGKGFTTKAKLNGHRMSHRPGKS